MHRLATLVCVSGIFAAGLSGCGGDSAQAPAPAARVNGVPGEPPAAPTVPYEELIAQSESALAEVNQWQFQLTVRHALEPIRSFAYRPVVTEADFCEAAQAWGGEVTVITADPAKEQSLEATCSEYLDAIVLPAP